MQDSSEELSNKEVYQARIEAEKDITLTRKIQSITGLAVCVVVAVIAIEMWLRVPYLHQTQFQLGQSIHRINVSVSEMQQNLDLFSKKLKKESQMKNKTLGEIGQKVTKLYKDAYKQSQDILEISPLSIQKLDQLEQQSSNNSQLLFMLDSSTKELIRNKRIQVFQAIGNKSKQFLLVDIRNPWNLTRNNFQPPFMDTVQKKIIKKWINNQTLRFQKKYKINQYPTELPICVVVVTHNNAQNYRYEYNIQSVLNQNYSNYKIVIIDDGSTDGTGQLIEAFMKRNNRTKDSYSFITNKNRLGSLENLHRAISQHCNSSDLVISIKGSDQLLGAKVFQLINSQFIAKNTSLAYTNYFRGYPSLKYYMPSTAASYLPSSVPRNNKKLYGPMSVFKASLFLRIKVQDLKYPNGTWFQDQFDEAFMVPLLQMECLNAQHINQYVYLTSYGNDQHPADFLTQEISYVVAQVQQKYTYECLKKVELDKIEQKKRQFNQ